MATTMSTMQSPRNKKAAGSTPPIAMPQPQHKRPSLRYSLNHLGKALADVVGKESKSSTAHVRSASGIPTVQPSSVADRSIAPNAPGARLPARRPSIAGAFDGAGATPASAPTSRAPSQAQTHVRTRTLSTTTRGLTQHKATTNSPKRASPPKLAPAAAAPTGVLPIPRRRSLMVKGALAAPAAGATTTTTTTPSAAPVPVGTTKISIRPKVAAPTRASPAEDERPIEVKERRTDSPRGTHAAVGRTRERNDSRPSPVRSGSALPTPKGRASPTRNDQTPTPNQPKDDREKRRERREREKQAAEEKEREKKERKEKKESEKKEAMERERAKQAAAKKAEEAAAAQRASASGHRTSSSTTTLVSSIFTSVSRSNTGDSHSSGGSSKLLPPSKSNTAVFPRAAQTVILTPPDDEEEDEDVTIQTPMTRSRTATGSTSFGDISSPAISRTLLASISAQTESPIMAPLDQRLRHAGSVTSLNSSLPSPVHPSTVAFPPPAARLATNPAATKGADKDDEEWEEEGDVSALLETVISPLKGQATPAMPRFAPKSKSRTSARSRMPETPSRGGLPSRESLSYLSPAIPGSVQRAGHPNRPRESILSWDAIVERSRLDEGELEDMLHAPPPDVGLVSPDMRPARNLPRLTNIGPKRANLVGISDSEAEIEEETVHGQTISQVLFQQQQPPASPGRGNKTSKGRRELAEREKLWAAKEEAWQKERTEWEAQRAQWEAERAQWGTQQTQWNAQRTQWNTQQAEWSGQQAQLESQRAQWEAERTAWAAHKHELTMTIQAREDDFEALEQETSAHTADLEGRAREHQREVEALMRQVEAYKLQAQELRKAREKEAQTRCTSAWTNVRTALKADADACAADRAALKVILLGLEAMVRA